MFPQSLESPASRRTMSQWSTGLKSCSCHRGSEQAGDWGHRFRQSSQEEPLGIEIQKVTCAATNLMPMLIFTNCRELAPVVQLLE